MDNIQIAELFENKLLFAFSLHSLAMLPMDAVCMSHLYDEISYGNKALDEALSITPAIRSEWEATDDIECFLYHAGKKGFIGHFGTPVRAFKTADRSRFSFSWGHCHTTYLYANTLEELVQKASKWVDESIETDYSKSMQQNQLGF